MTTSYDPLGVRSTQTTSDGAAHTIRYYPAAETDPSGTSVSYLIGLTRETRTLTGADKDRSVSWYLTNRHGDKTHTLSEAGQPRTHTTYTDYGNPTVDSKHIANPGAIGADPYGFAGEYTTPTGSQPLGVRHYDPSAAAFTTPDDAAAGMLNPYMFAIGDPISFTDPTGTNPAWDWLTDLANWEGMPYVDAGLAVAGLGAAAAAFASGGATLPLAIAAIGALATLPAAANQISRDATGAGFLPGGAETAFNVVALAGGAADLGVAAATAGAKLARTASKLKMPKLQPVQTPEPLTYEAIRESVHATVTANHLNCPTACAAVRQSLLTGKLHLPLGERGGKYLTRMNFAGDAPGEAWFGPLTTEGQVDSVIRYAPSGAVFTGIMGGVPGLTGVKGRAANLLGAGHLYNLVRNRSQVNFLDGYFNGYGVRGLDPTSNNQIPTTYIRYAGQQAVLFEG